MAECMPVRPGSGAEAHPAGSCPSLGTRLDHRLRQVRVGLDQPHERVCSRQRGRSGHGVPAPDDLLDDRHVLAGNPVRGITVGRTRIVPVDFENHGAGGEARPIEHDPGLLVHERVLGKELGSAAGPERRGRPDLERTEVHELTEGPATEQERLVVRRQAVDVRRPGNVASAERGWNAVRVAGVDDRRGVRRCDRYSGRR